MAILIPAQPTGITSPTPVRAPRNETGSQHPNAERFVVPGRFSRSGKPARPIYQSMPCGYLGLDRFKMYFQRAYHPCRTGGDELTGHNTPFQREGTPRIRRFEVSGWQPNLPRRRLSRKCGNCGHWWLGKVHPAGLPALMYLPGMGPLINVRELLECVASKCRAGSPTYCPTPLP